MTTEKKKHQPSNIFIPPSVSMETILKPWKKMYSHITYGSNLFNLILHDLHVCSLSNFFLKNLEQQAASSHTTSTSMNEQQILNCVFIQFQQALVQSLVIAGDHVICGHHTLCIARKRFSWI
jgi:hypothetical protein